MVITIWSRDFQIFDDVSILFKQQGLDIKGKENLRDLSINNAMKAIFEILRNGWWRHNLQYSQCFYF